MRRGSLVLALLLLGAATATRAQSLDRFREQAQAVCMDDVMTICSEFIPDEEQIMSCMQARRAELSGPCRQVFDSGMKVRRKPRPK